MKKVLKVIGIIILPIVVLIAGLLFFLSIKTAAQNNYTKKTLKKAFDFLERI